MYTRHCSLVRRKAPGGSPRFFNKSLDIISSPADLAWLYRAEDSQAFFTLSTFFLGRFGRMHYQELHAKHILDHQKSSRLISSTSNKQIAYHLAKDWARDLILEIDAAYIRDHLVDTARTIQRFGTDYYTKIDEYEHNVTMVPLCAIKTIDLINQGVKIKNPLFVEPTPESIRQYQSIYKAHLNFLELLFHENIKLSSKERQNALSALIEINVAFYENTMPLNNPFNMTLSQFREHFNRFFEEAMSPLANYDPNRTMKEIMHQEGDRLLMSIEEYRMLLASKKMYDAFEEDRAYYGRSSYQYE